MLARSNNSLYTSLGFSANFIKSCATGIISLSSIQPRLMSSIISFKIFKTYPLGPLLSILSSKSGSSLLSRLNSSILF